MNTTIKEISLIRTEEYVRLSIYNTSGELVRRLEQSVVPGAQLSLDVDDVFYIKAGEENSTTIKLGDAGNMQWDGKNSLGALVSSGMYEVSVEVKDGTGYTVYSTKTITVLNEMSGPVLSDVKAYPNPAVADEYSYSQMRIQWAGTAEGDITVRVYNTAAELVTVLRAKIADAGIDWDMETQAGSKLSGGFYAAVIEAVTKDGVRERAVLKLAIIR
jgi:flagellar hook assembly protein FlgD